MNIDFLTLKYLIEVGKTECISRAAQNLFISQPHLSNIIRTTELELGAVLFHRSVKGVEPTEEGRAFLRRAQEIVEQVDSLEHFFRISPEESLHIHFSATRSYQVMLRVAEFVNRHAHKKQINLKFKGTNPFAVVKDVCSREADFGMLHYFDTQQPYFHALFQSHRIISRPFYDREFLLVMSQDNPLAKIPRIDRKMLEEQTTVLYGDYEDKAAPYDAVIEMTHIVMSAKRIYVYDRADAMDLLSNCPDLYMWITGLNANMMEKYRLVMRRCDSVRVRNRGDIIYLAEKNLSPIHQELLQELLSIDWTEQISPVI